MADFGQNMQRLMMTRPFQHFSEMDMNMAVLNQFAELKPCMSENFNNISDFSLETHPLAHHPSEFPADYTHSNFLSSFHLDSLIAATPVDDYNTRTANEGVPHESKQTEVREQSTSVSHNISCSTSTADFEGDTNKRRKNRLGRGKKARSNEKEEGKPEEVVHVRAKRGQATDSHSIAERVRREKINKKMRCLQDLVPGCHKTMGMAGMLEEIINYVHSLQNQVEFLSMELAAACSSYDLNPQLEANRKTQGTNSHEAWAREAYEGHHTCFHSTWSL